MFVSHADLQTGPSATNSSKHWFGPKHSLARWTATCINVTQTVILRQWIYVRPVSWRACTWLSVNALLPLSRKSLEWENVYRIKQYAQKEWDQGTAQQWQQQLKEGSVHRKSQPRSKSAAGRALNVIICNGAPTHKLSQVFKMQPQIYYETNIYQRSALWQALGWALELKCKCR